MLKHNISQKHNIRINHRINSNIIHSIKVLQMSANEVIDYTQEEVEKNPFLISSKPYSKITQPANINNYSKNYNIKEWLYEQSSFISVNIWSRKLVKIFIENLNNKGFCKISIQEAAKIAKTSEYQSKYILEQLQQLDPDGIFSRTLEEYLSFQLKKKNIFNKNYKIIIDNLNDVATGNYKKLAKLCSLQEMEIINIINNIKLLKPAPIDSLAEGNIERIVPDIIVETHNKNIICTLNKTESYQVLIDEKYINEIKTKQNSVNNKEVKEYIKNCIAHGKTLQNSLNRRNNTLLLVTEKILNHQKDFFFKGEEGILPLTHKLISEKILINESTVSRTVKNKYIKFENIVLPLKYFFTSKTNTKKTNNNSAILIKAKIKKIIDIEKNKNVIYSDKNIADILGKENIIVARRTVTKYRENLNIANSVVRSKNNIQL